MTANPTIDIRSGEELDIGAIDLVLKQAVPDLSGQPVVTQYASGASNLTYALDYPDRRWCCAARPLAPNQSLAVICIGNTG